jgi:polyisoprenoid-binding protein YceI
MAPHRLFLVCAVLGASLAPLQAAEFVIAPDAASRVEFVSKAPMETFSGSSRKVSGTVSLDPAALADSITVEVRVDMASLDTGIELRNRHMRENHLHTEKYPTAIFRGGRLSKASAATLTEGQPVTAVLAGELELHGVKKKMEAPIELTLQKGGGLRVVSRFKVNLPDYDIPRPQFLVMKLDEVQAVTAELEARPQ